MREEVDFLRSCYPFPRNGFFRRSVPVLFSFMPTQLFFFQFHCCYAFIPLFFISLSSFLFCDLLFRIFSPSLSFSFFKNYKKKKSFSPPFSFHMFLFSIFFYLLFSLLIFFRLTFLPSFPSFSLFSPSFSLSFVLSFSQRCQFSAFQPTCDDLPFHKVLHSYSPHILSTSSLFILITSSKDFTIYIKKGSKVVHCFNVVAVFFLS